MFNSKLSATKNSAAIIRERRRTKRQSSSQQTEVETKLRSLWFLRVARSHFWACPLSAGIGTYICPLQPCLLSCMSWLFYYEIPNCSTPMRPKQIWIPQVQEEGGSQEKLPVVSTAEVEMVLEVKRWNSFKKVFNVCV